MCFRYEPDWYASIQEDTTCTATTPVRCDECWENIPPGTLYHHTYQQQAEECLACENGDCECQDGVCCACEDPDVGETFDYDCCHACHLFLDAMKEVEMEAGCRPSEARPGLGELHEELVNTGPEDVRRYWRKAAVLYPELRRSGYLKKLWKELFARRPHQSREENRS